jgi:tetratricopeptide (TPR) repeat protein
LNWSLVFFVIFSVSVFATELDETMQSFIKENELQKAFEFLTEKLKLNPEDRETKFYLGKIHFDGDSSFKYLSEAIDLNQRDENTAEALIWMAKYSFLKGTYTITSEQTSIFEEEFDQSTHLPEALWLSGCSYLTTGYTEEAEKQFRKIPQNVPGSKWAPWAHLGLGDCFFLKKEFGQAIIQYRKVIELYADSDAFPLALIYLCQSYIETKDVNNALLYYNLYQDRFPSGITDREKIFEKIRAQFSDKIKTEKKEQRRVTKYTIEVGLFSNKNQAQNEYRRFKSQGYTTRMVEVPKDEAALWRVEVGIFNSQKKAEDFKDKLQRRFGKAYKVISR